MEDLQDIKICKALRLAKQSVGRCSRTSFYRWMADLSIQPEDGVISKSNLALLCTWGKAMKATGSKLASARAVSAAKTKWTEAELYDFAFNPNTTFTCKEFDQYAS